MTVQEVFQGILIAERKLDPTIDWKKGLLGCQETQDARVFRVDVCLDFRV